MSRCPDARLCLHAATPPPEEYVIVRGLVAVGRYLRAFEGWPGYHLAAIARARAERGMR